VEPYAHLPTVTQDRYGVTIRDRDDADGELLGAKHRGERQENDKHLHL
jgi:hypothetical protein